MVLSAKHITSSQYFAGVHLPTCAAGVRMTCKLLPTARCRMHLMTYVVRLTGPYKASLLKAFQRTVEEARFTFVIVDANNIRFEDFKMFWSAGQVSWPGITKSA